MEARYTTAQVAAQLGIDDSHVRRICRALGIGELITPRLRLLTPADVRAIQASRKPVGNPNFGKKNDAM